jgi:Uma2 family endonuclease
VHESVVGFLIELFRVWLRAQGGGFVGGSNARFAVFRSRGRKPDVSVYFPGERPPNPTASVVDHPPTLVVEVVSSAASDVRRDRVEKFHEYAVFGVHHYWLLDPQVRTLEVYELGADGRYARARGASGGRVEGLPGCPDLVVDLDVLWAEVDRLLTAG